MASSSWVVSQSEQALKQRINSHSKHRLDDNINSKHILPRRLKFVRPKKQQNARPMSYSSSNESTPPRKGRQHSDFKYAAQQLYDESQIPALMPWKSSLDSVGSGLRNLGNSCFMNATLQCLCYTAPFQNYIATKYHTQHCHTNGYCIFCQLQRLLPEMLYDSNTTIPRTVFKNLRLLSKKLRPGRQEDAQEFLRFLMEGLQNNCLKQERRKVSDMRTEETTFIHKLWGGYLRSQIKCCRCGYESNTYESMLDISLEIKGPSLRTAFKHFTDPEILDGDNKYQCDNCKKKRRAIKQFTLFEPPNILCIHLKRFECNGGGLFSGGKINNHIRFEQTLDITEYMSYQTCPKVSYSLFGVLVHYGYSSHGGHYVSYIRAADDRWYLMDDSRCQSVSVQTVLKEKAYLLFYQRSEYKVLYRSPGNTPQKRVSMSVDKRCSSIGSFDSLQELVNSLPAHTSMFQKKIKVKSIAESPKSSSLSITPKSIPKPKTTLHRHKKTSIHHKPLSNTSSDDIHMSDARLDWQKNTNVTGEKRKFTMESTAPKCIGIGVDNESSENANSPSKRRKLNMSQLRLLKHRLSKSKSSSVSITSSSPSFSNCNKLLGRRSHALRLAAKTTLISPPKKWNRRMCRRASQVPASFIHNCKWKRQSSIGTLSDNSSDSVLSEHIHNSNHSNDTSSSTSPEIVIPPMNTTLPTSDGSSPHTLRPRPRPRAAIVKPKYRLSSMITDSNIITQYLNSEASDMSAIGIGSVGTWNSEGNGQETRDKIVRMAAQPIVSEKDDWDLALDTGLAYPHKSKAKIDPFKDFNRKEHINVFQKEQQSGNGKWRSDKKKKGSLHNQHRYNQRQKHNV